MYKAKINTTGGSQLTDADYEDGSISLKNIEFTYPTKKDIKIIQNASITVEKNKTIALVGTSGCGKSTIIQLIERFYDPDAGSVHYGKQNIADVNPESYKQYMAIVQQEPVLFSGTIRDNIGYGMKTPPTEDQLDEACA